MYQDDDGEEDCGLNGYGRVIYDIGDYYEGYFKNGKRHGKFYYTNGEIQDGIWEKEEFLGEI